MADLTGPFQIKRGTTSAWAASGIPLREGEWGLDTTVKRAKLGDGVTLFPSLPWAVPDADTIEQLQELADTVAGAVTPSDAVIAANINTPGTATKTSLDTAIAGIAAPVALGRSIDDFGASPTNTQAQNVTAIRAAVAWAQTNSFGARTLFVPDKLYIVNDDITITGAGIRVIGTGARSRIKQAVRTKPVFRACGPGQYFSDLHFIGADNRDTIPDGGGADLIRDNHPFANHCGIVFQYGSDGGTAERISGDDIAIVVGFWGWSDTANDYAGYIDGLTIRSISGTDVWGVVFGRECDNLTIDDLSGTYKRISTIFADPHGIYLTSSNYVATLRPLHNVNVSNLRFYDSVGGEPIALKNIYGGSVTGINVRNTPGIGVFAEVNNFTIGAYVADEIWKDPAQVGTANSPSGGQVGMITFAACKNVTVAPGSRQKNKAGNQAKSIVFTSTDNEDVTILEPDITTFHATEDLADNRAEVYVYGVNVGVVRPNIKMRGAARHGVRMGGATPFLVDPEISGCAQAIITDAATDAKVYDYNPGKITRAVATLPPIRVNASGDSLKEVLTTPPAATVWDRGLFASPSGRVIETSSGHKPNGLFVSGVWNVSGGDWSYALTGSGPRYLPFETGSAHVAVESFVTIAPRDTGGDTAVVAHAGHVLRQVSPTRCLTVDVQETGVAIRYRNDNPSLFIDTLTAPTGSFDVGRRYRLRSVVFGNKVQAYVDGVLAATATLTEAHMTALGMGTHHGLSARQNEGARWSDLRISKLGAPVVTPVVPYNPATDTSLLLWLDPTTLTEGTITAYADKSPAARNVTTFTGTNVADMDGLNGTPCVLFGGSNRLRTDPFTATGLPVTLMFNGQSTISGATQYFFDGGLVNTLAAIKSATASVGYAGRYSGTAGSLSTGITDVVPHSFVYVFNGVDTRLYVDGVLANLGDQSSAGTFDRFTIGSSGGTTAYLTGKMGDTLVAGRAFTDAEAIAASTWLKTRRAA